MDSIRIETGEKRIAINDDPARVIVFNPSDVLFAEKFYKLSAEIENKLHEYERRAKNYEIENAPVETRIELLKEICNYTRAQIDYLFGAGTSQIAFGDALNIEMFSQFFDGVTPFITIARGEKLEKYASSKGKGILK